MARTKKYCLVDGCAKDAHGQGYCGTHYQRFRKHGVPVLTDLDRFFKRVDKTESCWVWAGTKRGSYGIFSPSGPGPASARRMAAHRFSYEAHTGPIPDGMVIDHICHNKLCVNPGHLREATRTENMWNLPGSKRGEATGFRNVNANGRGFSVTVTKSGKERYFGTYRNVETAARVAEIARVDLFGEFAGKG